MVPATLFAAAFLLCFHMSTCDEISLTNRGTRVPDFLVWNCADENLKLVTENAMQQYGDVDQITESMKKYLKTYRGGGWTVLSINYIRTTADATPDHYASADINLCYISIPSQQLVTILAKIN